MWYVSLVTSLHYLISSSASDSLKGADDDDGKNKRNWREGAGLGGWVWGRLKKRIPDECESGNASDRNTVICVSAVNNAFLGEGSG